MPIKILSIGDEATTIDSLAQSLRGYGYQFTSATYGLEGFSHLPSERPDVVILDPRGSAVDVWEVCRRLRRNCEVPILVLSANDSPSAVTAALEAGADDYLIKPVSTGVLVAHINNLTRRAIAQRDLNPITRPVSAGIIPNLFQYPDNSQ